MKTNRGAKGERHPLHSLCSYLGCFPPSVPARILDEWMPNRGVVLDPFCGSGTTLLECTSRGHPSIGIDLNPLAIALARAKTSHVSLEDVLDRIMDLARGYRGRADLEGVPDGVHTIFHPRTLAQLVYLREALRADVPEDAFLTGAILGIMHGKWRRDGTTAYLSIDMPNTFSMSPEYVRNFVRKHRLKHAPVDVFVQLRERAKWLLREGGLPPSPGTTVIHGDATSLPALFAQHNLEPVDAIVTSPPYLGVLRYGAFNWIRLWFLGFQPAAVDRSLDGTDSLDRYLSFMASFLKAAAEVVKPGKPVALVIGDVKEFGTNLPLAERVWEELSGLVPFECAGFYVDLFNEDAKTTRIWGEDRKGRATPLDRILVLKRARVRRRTAVTGQDGKRVRRAAAG